MNLLYPIIHILPDVVIESAGRRYLVGNSLEEGIDNICRIYDQYGYFSSFDIVGEDAGTTEEANDTVNYYLDAIDLIASRFNFGEHPHQKPVSISVKPSAICLVYKKSDRVIFDSRTSLQQQLGLIAKVAGEKRVDVTLDMEDYRYTAHSLAVLSYLRSAGYRNLGGVLQSCLYRTEQDVAKIIEDRNKSDFTSDLQRFRVCRGIYTEPKEIATSDKSKAKLMLINRVRELLAVGIYVEIATHDQKVITTFTEDFSLSSKERNVEFQFLLGVPVAENILAPRLFSQGYTVRFYAPVKIRDNGTKYMRRRLMESPGMVLDGASANLFGGKPLLDRLG